MILARGHNVCRKEITRFLDELCLMRLMERGSILFLSLSFEDLMVFQKANNYLWKYVLCCFKRGSSNNNKHPLSFIFVKSKKLINSKKSKSKLYIYLYYLAHLENRVPLFQKIGGCFKRRGQEGPTKFRGRDSLKASKRHCFARLRHVDLVGSFAWFFTKDPLLALPMPLLRSFSCLVCYQYIVFLCLMFCLLRPQHWGLAYFS